jgi:hypothetical protein
MGLIEILWTVTGIAVKCCAVIGKRRALRKASFIGGLANYNRDGRISSDSRVFLFTIATIAEGSFRRFFLENPTHPSTSLAAHAGEVLDASRS